MKLYISFLILLLTSFTFASTLSGKIVDENGNPIPGVSITYDNTGTTTDLDGVFYINSKAEIEIRVQHIGYKTEILIMDSDFMDIKLKPTSIVGNAITVKSGYQTNALSELPSSISVIDQGQIKNKQGEHFQGFINSISNLSWTGGTSRARYYHIRGIGEAELYSGQGASNYSVGFTIDNIDFTGIGMPALLLDMKQVEIYKGPQSSIYGANSMAGLISMESNDPVPYFEGMGFFGIGTDILQYGTMLNSPINKNLNYRMALLYSLSTGFRENTYKDDYTNRRQELIYRGKMKWTPTPNLDFTVSGIISDQNNGYDVWSPDNDESLIVLSDDPGKDSQTTTAFSIKTLVKNINIFDMIYITSYSNNDIETTFDGDWANDDYWAQYQYYNFDPVLEGYRWSFTEKSYRTRKAFTNEIRLMNRKKVLGKTDFAIGLYTKNMTETDSAKGYLMGGDISDLNAEFIHSNIAGYAKLSYNLTKKIKFDTSFRLEKATIDYNGYTLGLKTAVDNDGNTISAPFEDRFSEQRSSLLNGMKLSLIYKTNTENIIFTSLSKGYKPGGINQHPTISNSKRFYETEYNLNTEIGYKVYKDRFSYALTIFNIQRKNQQVQHAVQSANNPIAYSYFTANATSGYNYGLELDTKYLLTKALALNMSLGLLESMVDSYIVDGVSYGDRASSNAPKYTYNFSGEYTFLNQTKINIEYTGKDSFYISNDSDQIIKGYGLLNASVNYKYKNTSISIWGKNLSDKRYGVKAFYFGLGPDSLVEENAERYYVQWGDPVEYGATIQFKF